MEATGQHAVTRNPSVAVKMIMILKITCYMTAEKYTGVCNLYIKMPKNNIECTSALTISHPFATVRFPGCIISLSFHMAHWCIRAPLERVLCTLIVPSLALAIILYLYPSSIRASALYSHST
jgi:hypothetical protein